MVDKDKPFDIKVSSLGSFNFDSLTKEEALDKFEKVLAQREKQIEDLSLVVGSYNDKLMSAYERLKFLESENNTIKEKLTKKEKLLEQELENKEIMFIRLQSLENQLDSQNKPKETKLGTIDSFFNFLGGGGKNKSDTNIKDDKEKKYHNNQLNNIPSNNPSTINQIKLQEEPITQKPSIQVQNTTTNPKVNTNNTHNTDNSDKSVKLLDKMKALKKKNTEKNSQIEEKKDEASNALDTNSNNK